jgi:hypothetical protein
MITATNTSSTTTTPKNSSSFIGVTIWLPGTGRLRLVVCTALLCSLAPGDRRRTASTAFLLVLHTTVQYVSALYEYSLYSRERASAEGSAQDGSLVSL